MDVLQTFENEDSRMEARINPGFAMGQDVDTRDQTMSTTIQIEPLPELLAESTPRKPKIACVEKTKQEAAFKLVGKTGQGCISQGGFRQVVAPSVILGQDSCQLVPQWGCQNSSPFIIHQDSKAVNISGILTGVKRHSLSIARNY